MTYFKNFTILVLIIGLGMSIYSIRLITAKSTLMEKLWHREAIRGLACYRLVTEPSMAKKFYNKCYPTPTHVSCPCWYYKRSKL